jgi:hypothetical protein
MHSGSTLLQRPLRPLRIRRSRQSDTRQRYVARSPMACSLLPSQPYSAGSFEPSHICPTRAGKKRSRTVIDGYQCLARDLRFGGYPQSSRIGQGTFATWKSAVRIRSPPPRTTDITAGQRLFRD